MTRRARASVVLSSVAVAVAVASTWLASSEARAESAPPAPVCRVLLLPNGSAPANLPAVVVEDRSSPGLKYGIVADELAGPTSSVKLGTIQDPRTPDVTLLVPPTNDPLEAGVTYALDYTTTCSNGSPASPTTVKLAIGPAVPLPTSIGTAKELADGTAVITPSTELSAFIQTARFEVFVDGASIGVTRYGAAYGDDIVVRPASGYVTVGNGFASTQGATPLCTPGTKQSHEVKLLAHVAGADGDTEPLTFSVEADCTKPASGGGAVLPDGGGDDRGASGGPDDSTDGAGGNASSSSGGCTVTGGGPLGSLAALFATGAAVAVLLRRRRAR